MNDPYKVLGISPNSTDDEVKAAYRELARKYHPDKYVNNPLADLAQEKMKDINEAYDTIQKMRRVSSNRSYSDHQNYQANTQFADIRRLISQNRIPEAEELLKGIPINQRNGEWYFLMGSIFYRRGWLDDAYTAFSRASSLDPNNSEYREAVSRMSFQRSTGRPFGQSDYRQTYYNCGGCGGCDLCTGLICADCCCECLGGDLIRCC